MLNKLFDAIMEVFHHLLGSMFWRVDHAKKRRNLKKKGFSFTQRIKERGITVCGARGVTRKWK